MRDNRLHPPCLLHVFGPHVSSHRAVFESIYIRCPPYDLDHLMFTFLTVDVRIELPPPKRRRTLAGSIVSTALSAALIGTAVGLTVYRL